MIGYNTRNANDVPVLGSEYKKAKAMHPVMQKETFCKTVDTQLAVPFQHDTSLPAGVPINLTALGTGFFNRVSNKTKAIALDIEACIQDNLQQAFDEALRILIVFDAQTNRVTSTWDQVVADYSIGGTPTSTWCSHYNPINKERYLPLYDRTEDFPISITNGGNGVSTNKERNVKIRIELPPLITTYGVETSNDLGTVRTGAILLFCVSQQAGNGFTLNGCVRYCYEDHM